MSAELPAGTPVVCSDLDRTLVFSTAAMALDRSGAEPPRLRCVETHRGRPVSYMTETAAGDLRELGEVAVVVPTTTRTPEQLARIRLPGRTPGFAIACNGGQLLVDGRPDPRWAAEVRGRLAECAPVSAVLAHLDRNRGGVVRAPCTAGGLFVHAVVDRPLLPPDWMDELEAWCRPRGWRAVLQGRKVYAVPRPLTKSAAAREVVRRCGGGPLLAAGDSLLDADLLACADRAIRPAHGELADRGFRTEGLAVTASTGVRAGEEVLAWCLREVRGRCGANAERATGEG